MAHILWKGCCDRRREGLVIGVQAEPASLGRRERIRLGIYSWGQADAPFDS